MHEVRKHLSRGRHYHTELMLLVILLFCGCQHWSSAPEPLRGLPLPRMKPGSVVLEIAVVEMPESEADQLAQIWPSVDEQAIPIEKRRQLDQNGFRCGVLGSQLPSPLLEILDGSLPDDELTRQLDSEMLELLKHRRTFVEHQRMQLESGEEHWVASASMQNDLLWSMVDGGQLKSGTVEMGRCGFVLVARPRGNGLVRLTVTPVIKHGPLRPRYEVSGDSFVYQARSDVIEFGELELEHQLRPGHTLILSPTHALGGLAATFFASRVSDGDTHSRRFLMIRVVQTQEDDLFAPRRNQRPLATSTN